MIARSISGRGPLHHLLESEVLQGSLGWRFQATICLARHVITKKKIQWIDAAPAGAAAYVELAYTFEGKETVQEAFEAAGDRRLLEFVTFRSGEAFFVAYYHAKWENRDLKVPGEGKVNDLMFSADDPFNTGRPVRICFGPLPTDGDAVVVQELGGYAIEALR